MQISITGIQARDKALKGAKYVAQAVKSTIGPFGMNALIEKGDRSTNDGYLISQNLCPTIKDEFEKRGAVVGHQASARTNDIVGDATSSAWALEDAICDEALRYLPTEKSLVAKKSYAEVDKMIQNGKNEVLLKLKELTTPIESKESLIKSALVSVEDEKLAELLGSTQWELGESGMITVEEVNDTECSIERVKGIRIDNGFSNSVIINNYEKQSFEISDTNIILTNYTIGVEQITALNDSIIQPLLAQKRTKLVIMARAFTAEAIQLCIDTTKTGFGIYPVNAPYTDQAETMRDLEAIVGGRYIDSEEAKLEDMYLSDVGYCKSLTARRFDAIITGVDNDKTAEKICNRVEILKKKHSGSQSEFEKKNLETRIAQFTNGFAILKVGAQSTVNRKRIKDKCDDAVNAVRLALKGGTVRGAGIALKEVSESLDDTNILKRPICVIHDQIMSSAPEGWEVEDWVRDPYLVIECALTNACDVASTLIRTNIIVAEENKKKKEDEE